MRVRRIARTATGPAAEVAGRHWTAFQFVAARAAVLQLPALASCWQSATSHCTAPTPSTAAGRAQVSPFGDDVKRSIAQGR